MSDRRIELEAAYILHQRPFRDSSQILDVLSADHGKLSLVARGSRGGRSRLKGILRPFQRLRLSWVQKSDLGTLTGAEVDGPPSGLAGDALMSAYYVNELLIHFLHRHDPQPEIFAVYRDTLDALAGHGAPAVALRRFEIDLLRLLGYALDLEYEARSGELLDDEARYAYRVEEGPVRLYGDRTEDGGQPVYSGARLKSIAALDFADAETLAAANRLLRRVIHHHLGGRELKTRKVLIDLHRDRMGARDAARRPKDQP